eukprot:jgi/Astpho2/981/Aster-x0038
MLASLPAPQTSGANMASPFAAPSFQTSQMEEARPSTANLQMFAPVERTPTRNKVAPRVTGPPVVPHGSLGKGSGKPTNLAKSFVLVSKVLTNSDTHGRIILPRVAVEANLSFLMGYRSYKLQLKDASGRMWDFVIKSWANGTEHRRVYVLEQAAEYLRTFKLSMGDAVGICTNQEGELVIKCIGLHVALCFAQLVLLWAVLVIL